MKKSLAILLFVIVGSSCSPRIAQQIGSSTQIQYRDRIIERVDSVVVRDSVVNYLKGDTVFIEKYRDRWRTKYKTEKDTIFVQKTDTLLVEKKIEKELTAFQKAKIDAFWWLVLFSALCVFAFSRK